MRSTLWSTSDRQRHFIVPDGERLPKGNTPIRTVSGRQTQVQIDLLARHEVSEEEANRKVSKQARELLLELKRRLQQRLDLPSSQQSVIPDDALFKAEMIEGAASFIGWAAERLVSHMRDQAETLRGDASAATGATDHRQTDMAGDSNRYSNGADSMNGYRMDGIEAAEDEDIE